MDSATLLDPLLSGQTFAILPTVWLLSASLVSACQSGRFQSLRAKCRNPSGYSPLPPEGDQEHLIHPIQHPESNDAEQSLWLVVPSLAESLFSALQALVMSGFTAFLVLTSSAPPAHCIAWAFASVVAAVDVQLRRKPVSKHSPPRYLHVSRGFILGGFLVFALNDAIYHFLSTWPSFHPNDDHINWTLLLAPLAAFALHVLGHRSSYVDLPDFPRFPAASAWEGLTLRWMWPTIRKSMQVNRLEIHDCADFLPDDMPANVFSKYLWYRNQKGYSVGWAAIAIVRRDVAVTMALSLVFILCGFIPPFAMNQFLRFLESPTQDLAKGYALCLLMLVGSCLRLLSETHCNLWARVTGFRTMSLFNAAVAHALLQSTQPPSNAVSLAAGDARKLCNAVGSGAAWGFLPLRIFIAFVGLVQLLGWIPVAVGVVVILVSVPINMWVAKQVKLSQRMSVGWTDKRLAVSAQTFEAIRLLKTQVWESHFFTRIDAERTQELVWILRFLIWSALLTLISAITPMLVTVLAFVTHASLPGSERLTPAQVFTGLYLFQMLDWPLRKVPEMYARAVVLGKISWERLSEFISVCEGTASASQAHGLSGDLGDDGRLGFDGVVIRRSANFALAASVEFPQSKLTVVVGPLGSGKTSLLLGLLGELPIERGAIHRPKCPIALVEQTVFILNDTVRSNILFGSPWDPIRYARVIEQCALTPDLSAWPLHDLTLIGDRGLSLSGGQRQRVALARAMYSNAPVILCDDSLSAVDPATANHLYHQALVPAVKQDGRTVVLVSHAVSLAVSRADHVVAMNAGSVVASGPPSALIGSPVLEGVIRETLSRDGAAQVASGDNIPVEDDSQALPIRTASPLPTPGPSLGPESRGGNAKREEHRSQGSVQRAHYVRYIRAFGSTFAIVSFVLLCVLQALQLQADLTLKSWSSGQSASSVALFWFASLKLASALVLATSLALMFLGSFHASRLLHRDLVQHLLAMPSCWFDNTASIGQILNRLSKDMSNIDSTLIPDVKDFIVSLLSNLTSLVAIVIASPKFLVMCVPFVALYSWLGRGYLRTSRDVRRMTNTFYSPVVQTITEFHAGGPCIRAYQKSTQFVHHLARTTLHNAMRPYISIAASNRWVMAQGDFVAALLCFTIALGFLIMSQDPSARVSFPPAWAGFALHYCLVLSESVRTTLFEFSLVEVDMSSVERVGEYLALETEPQSNTIEGVSGWPVAGPLAVTDLKVAYQAKPAPLIADGRLGELDWVLHGVSLQIPIGARVAVLGRTGSGKSTLFGALLRMVPHMEGTVQLAGVHANQLAPKYWRSQFGVVNQENYLFKGSLRENLDPLGLCSNAELLEIMDRFPAQLPFGLDHQVNGVQSLSKGQAQLVGLLRSMIAAKHKEARLFLCDEPTSATDSETDRLFWNVFRDMHVEAAAPRLGAATSRADSDFSSHESSSGSSRSSRCSSKVDIVKYVDAIESSPVTVIMIAHRVRTLIDLGCDYVVVMDAGRVVEAGHPRDLLVMADAERELTGNKVGLGSGYGWLARLLGEAGQSQDEEVRKHYGVPARCGQL